MARIAITGATGTIGRALAAAARGRGDSVLALSRDPERARRILGDEVEHHAWPDPTGAPPPSEALAGTDAVIHLLGEPVAQRWSDEAKREIRNSRVRSTHNLVEGLRTLAPGERPGTLISQSATGYYGPRGDEPVPETVGPGADFLAEVVVEWEREAHGADEISRVVCTRTGVVLSPSGGALGKMLPFFRLGLGGPVAGGRQYVPWIHLDDVVAGLLFVADRSELAGAVNLTAPAPVTNREMTRALARALHRPAVFPVPAAALRILYGEMATIVTTGHRVVPARLEQAGYAFRYTEIEPALRDLLA